MEHYIFHLKLFATAILTGFLVAIIIAVEIFGPFDKPGSKPVDEFRDIVYGAMSMLFLISWPVAIYSAIYLIWRVHVLFQWLEAIQ
jgi:hypothetical protein